MLDPEHIGAGANPADIQLHPGVEVPSVVFAHEVQENPLGELDMQRGGRQPAVRIAPSVPAEIASAPAEHPRSVPQPEGQVVLRKGVAVQARELEGPHHVGRERGRHVVDQASLVLVVEPDVGESEARRNVIPPISEGRSADEARPHRQPEPGRFGFHDCDPAECSDHVPTVLCIGEILEGGAEFDAVEEAHGNRRVLQPLAPLARETTLFDPSLRNEHALVDADPEPRIGARDREMRERGSSRDVEESGPVPQR
ncbi:MAG: hypothetical protein F4020_04060, partial [Gammaproteobacteria bacterium]|nr:hypothetical protein [Gammaproteobacteria bacterium]